MTRLNLEDYAGTEVRVLIGHDRGRKVREMFELDRLDRTDELVLIAVPASLRTLTPSFMQGLIGDSVHHLGEAGFFAHYRFEGPSAIQSDVKAGVDRVLTSRSLAGAA